MAKKAYIILQHRFVPAPGSNTSAPNFVETGEWEMVEDVYFVTRIRKRWWQEATTIVNISDGKIELNRADTKDYKDIVQHVQIKYAEHYNSFLKECRDGGLISKGV